MKKLILSAVLCGLTLAAFCQKSEVRSVSGFTGIDASGVFHVTVNKGDAESLTIEADEAVLPSVRSVVNNGVLHLSIDNRHKLKNIKHINASIVMKELKNVQLSGVCRLLVNDGFISESFKLECSGASNCEVNIKASTVDVDMSGASNLKLKAEVENAKIEGSGTPNIDANLQAENINLDFSGGTNVKLVGKADNLSIDSAGASKINAAGLEANTVNIDAAGASHISVFATEKLKVDSFGASIISYKGSPTIKLESSGASKLKRVNE
ncbi:DUF2807 domain-containing protein [Bacteroidia bacterium]|nr:DUF2807 domain-containing protein [Bacteroidia bacterium]